MNEHEPCTDKQCHIVDHCDRCGQRYPCDARILADLLAEPCEELAA